VARVAVKLEAETGIPPEMLIAQWALESKWGEKPAGNANFFGIKKAARHEQCCTVTTHEVLHGKEVVLDLEFADYDSLEASCRDYAWLITHGDPYREAWQQYLKDRSVHNLVFGIAQIYATGIGYAQLATQIASQSNVAQAIAAARAGVTISTAVEPALNAPARFGVSGAVSVPIFHGTVWQDDDRNSLSVRYGTGRTMLGGLSRNFVEFYPGISLVGDVQAGVTQVAAHNRGVVLYGAGVATDLGRGVSATYGLHINKIAGAPMYPSVYVSLGFSSGR
jgi:hypothetical protein